MGCGGRAPDRMLPAQRAIDSGKASDHANWRGCQVVELGSGCCLVSSVPCQQQRKPLPLPADASVHTSPHPAQVLMKLGAAVVATDLPELLPHMLYNLQLNEKQGQNQSDGCTPFFILAFREAQRRAPMPRCNCQQSSC